MNRTEAMQALRKASAVLAVSALVACGGGGGSAAEYAIGGTVSGLTGAGLVLHNNGGDGLPVSVAGAFTFATRVSAGRPYDVTVATQPTDQHCSVAQGSGTANATINTVAVTCAAAPPPPPPVARPIKLWAGTFGGPGGIDGPATFARFSGPATVVVDTQGNRYVADRFNHVIRRIAPDGVVTTLAGRMRTNGTADGVGAAARFQFPTGLALDGTGSLFVADTWNHTIRKIRLSDGEVSTVAGVPGVPGTDAGGGSQPAKLRYPVALTFLGTQLLVADAGNHAIRALLGPQLLVPFAGTVGQAGDAELLAEHHLAHFRSPNALAVIPSTGHVLVLDLGNCVVRVITSQAVQIAAGASRDCRSVDGVREQARLDFSWPPGASQVTGGLVVGPNERIFVADKSGLREMSDIGSLRSISLTSAGQPWRPASINGFAFERSATGGDRLLVAEPAAHAISAVELTETAGSARVLAGQPPGSGVAEIQGDFDIVPSSVAFAADGGVLVAGVNSAQHVSSTGGVTRLLALDGSQAQVSAIAQAQNGMVFAAIERWSPTGPMALFNGYQGGQLRFSIPSAGTADGPGSAAIDYPRAMDVDSAGRAVVVDMMAAVIRRVDQSGAVTRVAGQVGVYGAQTGDALEAALFVEPIDVAVATNGDIYVLDARQGSADGFSKASILKIAPVNGRDVVSVFVDEITSAHSIAIDEAGNLYVGTGESRCELLRIRPTGEQAVIAGQAGACTFAAGALPGALAMPWGGSIKVRNGRLLMTMENAVVKIEPLPQ